MKPTPNAQPVTRTQQPKAVLVSTDIRRDLVAPLAYFVRLRVVLYYRRAPYGDLRPEEINTPNLVLYRGAVDLFRRLWREKPDLVQGVEPFAIRLLPCLYAVLALARLQRIPLVVVSLENRPSTEKHGPVFSRLLRLALRPVFGTARTIIYLNEGVRRNVLWVGPYEHKLQRLMYGTWGVDLDEFTPARDGREPPLGRGPVLLYVGRLHAEKGVMDLLEAFGLVRERAPSARLVLVGDGPLRPELEEFLARQEWAGAVTLLGTVLNRDLPPILRAAQVFVAPSVTTRQWEEQVGMTNIQALACGLPVVSTRSGAIPEYVPDGRAGFLVPERDPQALAEAILRLLADEALRQRMGAAARNYALEHYDARVNVARAEERLLGCLDDLDGGERDI